MKYALPLIIASFTVAIATAMLEDGPLSLPFLVGYLSAIVVPLVVYSAVLTFVVAGSYRLYTGRDIPNLPAALWGIWVLVAAVNFFGNYQNQQLRRAEQLATREDWNRANTPSQVQQGEDTPRNPPATLALQTKFAEAFRQLDGELAEKVALVRIPPLFDPAFLEVKSGFRAAAGQLEDYARMFQAHKERRAGLLSQMKSELEQADLPQKEKLQALQEFNNTYELDGVLLQKYFDIVIEVSGQGIAYLDFLERTPYRVSNGRAVFETEADTDRYQTFLEIFRGLSEQEVASQRELADSRDKRLARLRELSR